MRVRDHELRVTVHAPSAGTVVLSLLGHDGRERRVPAERVEHEGTWSGRWSAAVAAEAGERYWLTVDGVGPLVDPHAADVVVERGRPLGVVRAAPWPRQAQLGRRRPHPVVYELHVRGFARTFAGATERLGYLAALGVDVVELMPVHPFDTRGNYWGYMPIVWGAVHRPYAADPDDAPGELAAFVRAAHDHGIAVWLDVVFNHTGEGAADLPTWTLRGLDDANAYRRDAAGRYTNDSGCGNDVDPADAHVRELVLEALERYADLGVDGFRFDLATVLGRDGGELIRRIGDWAEHRGVALVAEPWDLGAYQVGPEFPDRRWIQWNDRFRDDVRGFLRGEPGLVPSLCRRVSGSPDLFPGEAWRSLNFVTAHDGLTLHDLTAVTDDRHRAWDCGPELRPQQLANAFALLLLAAGPAMFVMGDELARTQGGHDNPYDVDGQLTWMDWSRLESWRDLHHVVQRLIRLRRLAAEAGGFEDVRCYGADGGPDLGEQSRSLAWRAGPLHVVANAWWDAVEFLVPPDDHGAGWAVALCTAPGGARWSAAKGVLVAPPRSVTVLVRT